MIASASLYGLCGAALTGLGLYGFVIHRQLLRRILAFNVVGSGIFLTLGAAGDRAPGLGPDPVPQALIITGIVVAFAATALTVALTLAYVRATGNTRLPEDRPGSPEP